MSEHIVVADHTTEDGMICIHCQATGDALETSECIEGM